MIKLIRIQMQNGLTNKQISESNHLSISCVFSITTKIMKGFTDEEIIKKKGRHLSSNTEINSQISAIVQADNALTQRGIIEALSEGGVKRSQSFISSALKKVGITRKRLSLVPIERNSPRLIEMRKVYGHAMNDITLDRLVFLDETGFNLHSSQNYGYSMKNTKAFISVQANRGINQSLMCAIDINGVVAFEILSGAYNGDKFKLFIETKLFDYFEEHSSSILVMDNCRFHHRQDVLKLLNDRRIQYKFIPPYSPQLNPIEEFFSCLKADYKAIRPRQSSAAGIRASVNDSIRRKTASLDPIFERMKRFILLGLAGQPFI